MLRTALLATLLLPVVALAEGQSDWLQWRGPERTGILPGAQWPSSLDEETLTKQWHVDLGEGYSGPIVAGDRVFTAETVDAKDEVARALDAASGKELWKASWPGAMTVPSFAKVNGDWIRATPACDGSSLYVAGMRDVLVCLDVGNGKERWKADLMERYKAPLPSFGFVCSPLVDGDGVYVQAGASVLKLNKATGETIWRTLEDGGGMGGSAFSSPIIAKIGGVRQLVVQTRSVLAGVDLASGKVLWSQPVTADQGMNILTPTVHDDKVFTSAYGSPSFLFEIKKNGDEFTVSEVWNNKAQAYMSTPVLVDGYLYMHLRNQRLTCIDWKSGETKWTTPPFGKYWSMVASGDKILALDEDGILRLIRANPEKYELISERKVSDESTWAYLAVAGERLYIRGLKGITAWDWKIPTAVAEK